VRIGINLASRPFADLGPTLKAMRIAMGALLLVAIAMIFGLHALHQRAEEARARDHSLDGQIARITSERQGYQAMMRQPQNAEVLTQAESLNKLFDEKAFSWTLAMEDLETVLPGGVQVTSIEPARDKDGHITLHLRVLGPRDRAIELVANLEHSRRFVQPRIVNESTESSGGPGEHMEQVSASNRVNFDLLAEYNPVTAAEFKASRAKSAARENSDHRKDAAGVEEPAARTQRPPYTGMARPRTPVKPRVGGRQ
jgi:type IV pilus assembly protein PilN